MHWEYTSNSLGDPGLFYFCLSTSFSSLPSPHSSLLTILRRSHPLPTRPCGVAIYFHRKDAKGNAAHSVRDRLTTFLFCLLLTASSFLLLWQCCTRHVPLKASLASALATVAQPLHAWQGRFNSVSDGASTAPFCQSLCSLTRQARPQ